MSQQAGWYDDPQNPDDLRYWDGVQWTQHTSPKRKPDLEQAGQGAQGGWGAAPGQQGQQRGYGQQGGPFAGQGQQGHGATDPYAGQGGQSPYQPMPGGFAAHSDSRATTPDGQPLAGWWHRVGARLIDSVLIAVVGGLIASVLVPGAWGDYFSWAVNAADPGAQPPAELTGRLATWSLVLGLVGLVYEIVMVAVAGGTVGKLVTGLRIRRREQPGNVGWGTSAVRGLVYQLLGVFAPVFLLNVLWPLWDAKRQTLHDKAARTNVVRHR